MYYEKRGDKIALRIEVEEGELEVREVRFGGVLAKGVLTAFTKGRKRAQPGRSLKVELDK
jgi:hypothetical protein